eukprot:CAMPEP_0180634302 /NCGR_PEP_ID=MMETSP1037_2-20121125/42054_1 /TAXON_ID=632150 /ORGANISM="Azadinium spinosum, Strain 3D9" /LENGTH=242 /DNA_ID=CAMNT_0022655425 /DNA_START=36 /DNA_END=760 /DNA_ORIENTATION=+
MFASRGYPEDHAETCPPPTTLSVSSVDHKMMAAPPYAMRDSMDQKRMGFYYDKSTYADYAIDHDLLLTSVGCYMQPGSTHPLMDDIQTSLQASHHHEPTSECLQAEVALRTMPTIQEVHDLLGFGSFSHVFKCTVEGLSGSPVAVKVLKNCVPLRSREASILMTMDHPNIVKLLDIIEGPCNALVMEFCAGGSLQSFLHAERYQDLAAVLTLRARVCAALDVAHALEYLHSKNTLHRDVKPA